jgi:hypothetical protein
MPAFKLRDKGVFGSMILPQDTLSVSYRSCCNRVQRKNQLILSFPVTAVLLQKCKAPSSGELSVTAKQAYDERQAQLTMDAFLSFNQRFAKIRSKRLQRAVKGITKSDNPDLMMDDAELPLPLKPQRKTTKTAAGLCTQCFAWAYASFVGAIIQADESLFKSHVTERIVLVPHKHNPEHPAPKEHLGSVSLTLVVPRHMLMNTCFAISRGADGSAGWEIRF